MKITEKTKISELIKHNPSAIDAIASINPHFEKLKNPILRKIMASRVNIADAAKIGGCDLGVFFEKLGSLGFEYDGMPKPAKLEDLTKGQEELSLLKGEKVIDLDVRAEIATGRDPFQMIMKSIAALMPGEALRVINTFEPVPLIKILENKGYSHHTINPAPKEFHTYFLKREEKTNADQHTINTPQGEEFGQVLSRYKGKLTIVDVREMEMPLPMVTILEELERLSVGGALFVYHHRVPKYLIAELEDRGFQWALNNEGEGQVNIIIYRP